MRLLPIIFLLLFSCKTYQPLAPQKQEENNLMQPGWVRQKPSSHEYFIGIGNAPLSDLNYQSNAKLEALEDLSSEISVKIESSSLLSQIENSAGFREEFRSAVMATSQQSIELHEQVDSWSDGRFYWVQYRLNKLKFHQMRTSRKQKAVDLAKSFFLTGLEAEVTNDLVQSTHLYAQTIESLKDYINERNEVTIKGKSISLTTEAYARILSFASNISIRSDSLNYTFRTGQNVRTIDLIALSESLIPVRDLPIRASMIDNNEKVTDKNGNIRLTVNRKAATNKLIVTVDFSYLRNYPITWKLIENIKPEQLYIDFFAPPITLEIISTENNLTESMHQQVIANLLKKILTNEGYRIIDSESEYVVEIVSDTRKGSQLSGLYTSFLDLDIYIRNQQKELVYSDSFSNIKGIHTSYKTAGVKAYQNVEKELSIKLKQSLKENFINKD